MSLQFNTSNTNFVSTLADEADVNQYVIQASNSLQKFTITNVNKMVVHCWGGGGGGGSSANGMGAGGGGSFTVLDFPYYPTIQEIYVEAQVGFGGTGGHYNVVTNREQVTATYVPASDGQRTQLTLKTIDGRILKEFVCYGGLGGGGDASSNTLVNGGGGGTNSLILNPTTALMDAYWIRGNVNSLPTGGNLIKTIGDHCQINYMNVTGSGGGANNNYGSGNDGGSFLLNEGGKGADPTNKILPISGGGGGSTYYGKGGDGITSGQTYTPNKIFKFTVTHVLDVSNSLRISNTVDTNIILNTLVFSSNPRISIPSVSSMNNRVFTIIENTRKSYSTFFHFNIRDSNNNVVYPLTTNTTYEIFIELNIYAPSITYYSGMNGELNSGAGGGGAPWGELIGNFNITYATDNEFKISATTVLHKRFAIASYYATHIYIPGLSSNLCTITPCRISNDWLNYTFRIRDINNAKIQPANGSTYNVSLYSNRNNYTKRGGNGGDGLVILEVYH